MDFEVSPLVSGEGEGHCLVLGAPLSFWGGLDPVTGSIVDVHHPQLGQTVTGRVLVMPHGRGSSSSSQVLTEALRLGTGPVAIVMSAPDHIVMLGSLVAGLMYDVTCPVVVADEDDFARIDDKSMLRVSGSSVVLT